MPAYRDHRTGVWRYRKTIRLPDGKRIKISGTPNINSRTAAEAAERDRIALVEADVREGKASPGEEVPTLRKWFYGRFWDEWVVGRKNKPSEVESKRSIFEHHVGPALGSTRLDEIDAGAVARFRAQLVKRVNPDGEPTLKQKTINNVMAVLSKPLHYAVEMGIVARAPRVGMFKVEPPEIVWWELEEYARIVEASRAEGEWWHVAVCLAAEAGLRIGEIRALEWAQVDLVGRTLGVAVQTRKGETGTPKGRTRRVVPMTSALVEALKGLSVVRRGFVVRNDDGTAMRDGQTSHAIIRTYGRAGVPIRGWHALRHTFATHAAMFGANPWTLNAWLGHKTMEETMRYVHVAQTHARPVPAELARAGAGEHDQDRRAVAMLGARAALRVGEEQAG